jgi:formiminoglutamase
VIATVMSQLVARGAERVYVDFDIDVIDRAFAPACPASLPGGMYPEDLFRAAHLLGADSHVVAADLCEVDANADVNAMTLRLMAATFLKFCSGLGTRARHRPST